MVPLTRLGSSSSRHTEDLDKEEYVIPLEKYSYIQNYFTFASPSATEKIELNLDGRIITVIGIPEEESVEEFQKAFGELIHPVVCNAEFFEVMDQFLREEILKEFSALYPRDEARGMGRTAATIALNEDEASLLAAEIEQHETGIFRPGDLRDSLERLPTLKLKRAILEMNEPIITPDEIERAQTAMRIRRMQKPFMDLIKPVVQHRLLIQRLEELPQEYRERFRGVLHKIQKRIDCFNTLIDDYTAIHTLEFVLGEEMNKRLSKTLPILWRLPKENIAKLHQLLEYNMMNVQGTEAAAGPSQDVVVLSHEESAEAAKLMEEFRLVKDYILNEKMFPKLLPFTNMSLHPWPRIERIKQAFRNYFPTENLLRFVSSEMIQYYERIHELEPELREQLAEALERKRTTDAKLRVLTEFPLPPFDFTPRENEIFVHFLTSFVPRINEILMEEIEPDEDPYGLKSVTEDMHLYYGVVKTALSEQEIEQLIEAIENAGTFEGGIQVLLQFHLPEPDMPIKEQKLLVSFLPLVLGPVYEDPVYEPLSFEERVRNDLELIEANARRGLDNTIRDAEVLVTYMQQGREITLGAQKPTPLGWEQYIALLEDEDRYDEIPESHPGKPVFVEAPEIEDDWETT